MSKIYVDLATVAHLFLVQQNNEATHRGNTYKDDPDMKERVRVEVGSVLSQLFHNILAVCEMSHPMSDHTKQKLIEKATATGKLHWVDTYHPLLKEGKKPNV